MSPVDVRCPYCHDAIASRADAVRCGRCATPHHRECWAEHASTCSVHACGGTEARPFTRRAAARIVVGAGKRAVGHVLEEARGRLGAKSVVALLLLSVGAVALATGWLAAPHVPTLAGRIEVSLLGVFVVMAVWLTGLLHRGAQLHDDLDLQVASTDLGAYYRRLWGGLGGERNDGDGGGGRGCTDPGCSGCGPVDGEGAALLLVIGLVVLALLAVGPLVAWVAVELVYPIVALAIYGVLYGALALAVHAGDAYRGRLWPSVLRGALFAGVYTGLVAGLVELGRWIVAR